MILFSMKQLFEFIKGFEEIIAFFENQKQPAKLSSVLLQANTILTERELEVITLISLELSGKEISEKLFISTNTVETHRKNIMKKIL